MKTKFAGIAIAVWLALFSTASGSLGQSAKKRPEISHAEKAYISWQVQNVMSKHAYYHAAAMHVEEIRDIWVTATGPNAKTAKFSSPGWIMQGISTIMENYGEAKHKDNQQLLEKVSQLYPEIKNVKENLGAGSEWVMHTNTTPIIEVAGDGKTAKGIWYSPGLGLNPRFEGKSVSVGGTFFWEKYGADFIEENGVWKLWHCQMFYDFTPPLPASMTASLNAGETAAQAAGPPPGGPGGPGPGQSFVEKGERMTQEELAQEGMHDNPVKYKSFSPTRVPQIMPRFPEPYYTFSETFSY